MCLLSSNKMENQKISFYNEISMMMFGFGDSHTPNPETVRLVENIVQSQLRLILQEALKYSKGEVFNGEELVFLMRRNKYKMRRFIKYLQIKILKTKMGNKDNVIETDIAEPPKHELMKFIEKIDETGELSTFTEFDEIKYERMIRADRISVSLNEEKYLKYAKARQVSFLHKSILGGKGEKLIQWIRPNMNITLRNNGLDVLTYYAYETVAQLMDYAFLVRLDAKRTNDPLSNLSGFYYNSTMFNGDHRFSGSNKDYSRIYSGQPPFSPNEIKEVMRRVYSSQTGKLMLGKKTPATHYILAL